MRAARCWICGDLATTSEHKIKKSDLIRRYGAGPYRGDDAVVRVRDGSQQVIQGPNSKRLQFRPSLCAACNNARTQPYDRAYQQFESWVFENEQIILNTRLIDLQDVYGSDVAGRRQVDLYKYFVKCFGCTLAEIGVRVPRHLVGLIQKERFQTALRITLAVNRSMFYVDEDLRTKYLGRGGIQRIVDRRWWIPDGRVWHLQIGWLRIGFWYMHAPWPRHGASWTADSTCLYLGDIEPASHDELVAIAESDGSPALEELLARRDRHMHESYPPFTDAASGMKHP